MEIVTTDGGVNSAAAESAGVTGGSAHETLRQLHAISRRHVGIVDFRWPGHSKPLHLRCGSSDYSNFIQIFQQKEYEGFSAYTPLRILDLGGYVGYAAAYFAQTYPQAEIVSVEPSADNFRMNAANTAGFANVRRINAGVSDFTGKIAPDRSVGGDWGSTFARSDNGVPCYALPDLMDVVGWDWCDFFKCDIEGSERELFRHCGKMISDMVNICAVEVHNVVQGAREAVYDCFDPTVFEAFRHGEFHYFKRRQPLRRVRQEHVLLPPTGLRTIDLTNVPDQPWGYYLFGGSSCQLHPANSNDSPAILSTSLDLAGQSSFESMASVANPLGYAVQFAVEVVTEGGRTILNETRRVEAGERTPIRVPVAPLHGRFVVKLSTRMASDSPTNHQAVANWHDPRFN